MSMDVLLQGTLSGDPVARVGKGGKTFATAVLRVPIAEGDAEFFSVIAFRDGVVQALTARTKGDALAISGAAQRNVYADKDGKERSGWKVVAEGVLSVYQARKARKEVGELAGEPF